MTYWHGKWRDMLLTPHRNKPSRNFVIDKRNINVHVYLSGKLSDRITRPLRHFPFPPKCGVVFKRRVYPLRVRGPNTSPENSHWFIEINDRSFPLGSCPPATENVPLLLKSISDQSAIKTSDINVEVYRSGKLRDGITRPVRLFPFPPKCGVIFKRRVYPLRFHSPKTSAENGHWFIEINDRSLPPDSCPPATQNVPLLLKSISDQSATETSEINVED